MGAEFDAIAMHERVANPLATIGFATGAIWVHCGETGGIYSTHDPRVLTLLAAFATPIAPQKALADDPVLRRHCVELARIGALTLVDGAAARGDVAETTPGDLVEAHLSPIASGLDALASTLSALAPQIAADIRRDSGVGLDARLMEIKSAIVGLKRDVDRRIPAWIAQQLAALAPPEQGLSLHLGAGSKAIDGWINIDSWPAQLALDLRWGLPFDDASAERVYLSHTLEHLFYPHEVRALLNDIARVLAPGGTVRIVVPDIEIAIAAYVDNDLGFFAGRRETSWPDWDIETRLESFLGYAGVGPHPGMFAHAHKYGYDFETLAHALQCAGFNDVRRCAYQASPDPKLRIDDASAYAGAQKDGRYYSLFVEARR
jgi:predicted SAM-dependent methyltransferase